MVTRHLQTLAGFPCPHSPVLVTDNAGYPNADWTLLTGHQVWSSHPKTHRSLARLNPIKLIPTPKKPGHFHLISQQVKVKILLFFFFLSNWLWWQNLYLATFWAFWDVPYWFSRAFPLTAISRSYRHLLILFHTFLVQQSQLHSLQSRNVLGHRKGPIQTSREEKAQWLIDNISKDYVPVYGSSQPYYPPWKWR